MMMQVGGFLNLDAWDGYPAEREIIFTALRQNNVENVIVVTGDIHSTWAGELTRNPYLPEAYNPQTSQGSVGVEFVTPSISSANLNELNEAPPGNPVSVGTAAALLGGNPHMRLVELDSHGYFLLDLQSGQAQADWWYVNEILTPNADESFAAGWAVRDGTNRLEERSTARPNRQNSPLPAPDNPPTTTSVDASNDLTTSGVVIMSLYPNPSTSETTLHYMLAKSSEVKIVLYDMRGTLIATLMNAVQPSGAYTFNFSTEGLSSGSYRCEIQTATGSASRSVSVIR